MIRKPAVAGYFYPGHREDLLSTLRKLISPSTEKIEAKGIVVPHAGYMYSGVVAGKVYGKIVPPDVAIILGPNHTGLGEEVSIFPKGSFLTPLGEVNVNENLSNLIVKKAPFVSLEVQAHLREHSLEVQVPFLQYLNPSVEIVAIALMDLTWEQIEALGKSLAEAIKEYTQDIKRQVLLVASSDFSHYEPHEVAKKKDSLAIREILNLSERGLLEVVYRERISMCGVLPVAVALVASKALGAKKATLIEYKTSGDITGDHSAVVGYGGLIIH